MLFRSVKGGEGGYEDYFGDAIITGITSFRVVTIGSTAGLSGASIASTDYYVSQLPKSSIVDFTFSEKNTTEQSLQVHFIDEAFAAMDVPDSASGTPGSRNDVPRNSLFPWRSHCNYSVSTTHPKAIANQPAAEKYGSQTSSRTYSGYHTSWQTGCSPDTKKRRRHGFILGF